MGIDTNKYRELYKENKQLQNENDLDDTKATAILMNTLTSINNKIESDDFETWLQEVLDNNIDTIEVNGKLFIRINCYIDENELHFEIQPVGCRISNLPYYINNRIPYKHYFDLRFLANRCNKMVDLLSERLNDILSMKCPKYDRMNRYSDGVCNSTTIVLYDYLISFRDDI